VIASGNPLCFNEGEVNRKQSQGEHIMQISPARPVRFGNQSGAPKPWHKLDPRSRYDLEQGVLQGKIEVLIRLDPKKQGTQQETLDALKKAGLSSHFATGHVTGGLVVSSGSIDVKDLKTLHDLDMVKQIEVSRPMFPETK
jgi:hypothetical protein